MKRACLLFVAAAITTLGCQSQPGQFGSPFATGPTRVPPPVTGSIGTPIPQPSGAQYYPGGSAAISAAPVANPGWNAQAAQAPPSTSLGVQSVARANPPAITPATSPAFNASAPASSPWQPAAVGNPTAQLFKTNAAPNTAAIGSPTTSVNNSLQGTLGVNVNGNTNAAPPVTNPTQPQPQPNGWGQPAPHGYQVPVGNPAPPLLNGMPVNDATSSYQNASPWSLAAWQAWWARTQQHQQAYPQQQYQQPIPQQQQWPAAGYATAAPAPGQLPVRGQQMIAPATAVQNIPTAPASMQWGSVPNGEVQNPPVSPAVQQWGGLPMASVQPASFTATATTVRGNDGPDAPTAAVAHTSATVDQSQSSGRFANDPQYQWLRGQLEYSVTQKRWKLRYIPRDAPEGRIDSFGGSVVLTPNDKLSNFASGAFVAVQGSLGQTDAGASDYAPVYRVDSVSAQ